MGHTDQGDTWFTIQSVKTESVTAMPSLYRGHDTPEEVALSRDFWKVYYPKRYLWFWMKPSLFKLRKPSLVRQVKEGIFIHTQLLSMASAPPGGCSFQPAWALLCGSTAQCPRLSRELFYAFLSLTKLITVPAHVANSQGPAASSLMPQPLYPLTPWVVSNGKEKESVQGLGKIFSQSEWIISMPMKTKRTNPSVMRT